MKKENEQDRQKNLAVVLAGDDCLTASLVLTDVAIAWVIAATDTGTVTRRLNQLDIR